MTDNPLLALWQEVHGKVKSISIPQWFGIHDYLTVYERNA